MIFIELFQRCNQRIRRIVYENIMISFIIINLVLSAFISATTAKAAILLPIFMVVAAIYGATGGEHRNNFG